jgi:hypothetical protein
MSVPAALPSKCCSCLWRHVVSSHKSFSPWAPCPPVSPCGPSGPVPPCGPGAPLKPCKPAPPAKGGHTEVATGWLHDTVRCAVVPRSPQQVPCAAVEYRPLTIDACCPLVAFGSGGALVSCRAPEGCGDSRDVSGAASGAYQTVKAVCPQGSANMSTPGAPWPSMPGAPVSPCGPFLPDVPGEPGGPGLIHASAVHTAAELVSQALKSPYVCRMYTSCCC